METLPIAYNAGAPRLKLTFAYDSQGRRLEKTVYKWDSGSFDEDSVTYVLYDRWNPIGQLVQTSHYEIQTYVWGNDLSGTAQGAGGVGGLLMVHSSGETHYPAYDGNGNVVAYIDSDTEDRVAEYEYSPFGATIRATGPEKDTFPFRFSTKYQDSETALLYYGYRYYDPQLGRWLSRDPIGEAGGLNLYGFVGNDGVDGMDYLGMRESCCGGISYIPGRNGGKRCCGDEKKGMIYIHHRTRGGNAGPKHGGEYCKGGKVGRFEYYYIAKRKGTLGQCIMSELFRTGPELMEEAGVPSDSPSPDEIIRRQAIENSGYDPETPGGPANIIVEAIGLATRIGMDELRFSFAKRKCLLLMCNDSE